MRSTLQTTLSSAAIGLLLAVAAPAVAHHSFEAEYDASKTINVSGIVTKLDWQNPHAFVFVDMKDSKGDVKHYKIEMGPPYALIRNGWARDTLKVGDKVAVQGAALAKDGSDAAGSMQSTSMTLASGQKLPMR